MAKVHISNIPFAEISVTKDSQGFVIYDEDGADKIRKALVARDGKNDQAVLSGTEFGEHDQNTRYFGWRAAMEQLEG